MIRRLASLRCDTSGTAMIELAMIAPMIAILTVGVVDISNGFSRKLKCEQAAQRAIEKIMNTSASDTIENTLAAEAADQANVPLSNVTVQYRLECNGTVTTSGDCGEGEQASEWIQVTVTDRYTPMFPLKFAGISGDGTYHLSSTAGVRIL